MFARLYDRDDMTIDGALRLAAQRPAATRPPRTGVALIEVVVTLTLLALLGALVIPALRPPQPAVPSTGGALESLRRATLREARPRTITAPNGASVLITPLGSCFPALPTDDATPRAAAYWDPLRCAADPDVDTDLDADRAEPRRP